MKTKLEEFILYGSLGWLQHNTALSEVTAKLGAPKSRLKITQSARPYDQFLLSYIDLEIDVGEGLVSGITLRSWSADAELPFKVELAGFKDTANITASELKSLLAEHDIEWVPCRFMAKADQFVMVTTNDVHLIFDDDERLVRVAFAPEMHSMYFK